MKHSIYIGALCFVLFAAASCGNQKKSAANNIDFKKYEMDSTYHLFGDAEKPAITIHLSMLFPVGYENSSVLEALQQLVLAEVTANTSQDVKNPEEAMRKFIEKQIEEYRLLEKDYQKLLEERTAEYNITPSSFVSEYTGKENNTFNKDGILCFSNNVYQFTGGAHGLERVKYICVDLAKGSVITNETLFIDDYESILTPIILEKLVEIQKGKITLSSTEGKGSSFTVTLSLPITQQEKETKTPLLPLSPKILIIDDDPSQLTMVSEQLKNKGITATTCHSPYIALEMIGKEPFDIIFTDIQMPELNGFELIKHIRSITGIPVVALSARADIHLVQFKEYGFSSFLSKPFTASQLFSVISECLSITNPDFEENTTTIGNSENRFKSLLSFASGEKESERTILQSFIDESKKNIENLLLLKEQENIKGINQLAHKMVPIFSMMNEREISEWLIALEKATSLTLVKEDSFTKRIEEIERIIQEAEGMKEG